MIFDLGLLFAPASTNVYSFKKHTHHQNRTTQTYIDTRMSTVSANNYFNATANRSPPAGLDWSILSATLTTNHQASLLASIPCLCSIPPKLLCAYSTCGCSHDQLAFLGDSHSHSTIPLLRVESRAVSALALFSACDFPRRWVLCLNNITPAYRFSSGTFSYFPANLLYYSGQASHHGDLKGRRGDWKRCYRRLKWWNYRSIWRSHRHGSCNSRGRTHRYYEILRN